MEDHTYKKVDAGRKELFSMLIYRPLANILLNKIFKYVNITPNAISFFSLILAIAASCCFAFFNYPLIIIGVILLHLVYTFDMLDGQYARFKGLSSKFGQWFDPFIDTIKISFLYLALSYGAYRVNKDYTSFLWGIVALTNSFLSFYILNTRRLIVSEATFEVKVKNDIYVGYEISLYWALSFFVIINRVYEGLIFLAVIGALSWIKLFISLRRYYYKNKTRIEGNA